MDRFIIREPRAGAECLQGNQIIAFPTSTAGNNMIPDAFYTPYGSEFQDIPENRYSLPHKSYQTNMAQGQNQMMSGIDPNYLAAYSSNNAQYTAVHQHMHREMQMERQMQFRSEPPFGSDYQNRSVNVERNSCKAFAQAVPREIPRNFETNTSRNNVNYDIKSQLQIREPTTPKQMPPLISTSNFEIPRNFEYNTPRINVNYDIKPRLQMPTTPKQMPPLISTSNIVPPKKPSERETPKNELQSQVLTRFDKLKALHKSGPRVFTGPVEKVLKWHKMLQDIGLLIIFEIIGKCVNIQPGQSCSKNLVVRDDNGPAMQVVYYEIDFLLPDLKPPCTVRVVGRMMPGTCRLQAFNVRPATGDDMATLSRRAAVASHHVAKLCKEYGPGVDKA